MQQCLHTPRFAFLQNIKQNPQFIKHIILPIQGVLSLFQKPVLNSYYFLIKKAFYVTQVLQVHHV